MDIRKWFTSPKAASSSSETTKTSKKHEDLKVKSKPSKKRRVISDSDSDDEPQFLEQRPSPKKKKKQSESEKNSNEKNKRKSHSSDDFESSFPNKVSKFGKRPSSKLSQSTSANADTTKPVKSASVADFFGNSPVERTFKKSPKKTQESTNSSIELNHEDEDFSKTLLQLEKTSKLEPHKNVSDSNSENASSKSRTQVSRRLSSDIEIIPSPLEDPIVQSSKIPKKVVKKKENGNVSKKRKSKNFSSEIEFEPSPTLIEKTQKVEKKKEVIKESPSAKDKKKKGGNGANYMSYLHRDGPRALGSKEIPEGEEGCLQGMTFIVTGVLESITRDETKELIEGHGGKLMNTLSKNTHYIIIGRDAGPSKLEKAEKLGTKQLSEDDLFDLVRNTPGKGPKKIQKKSPEKLKEEEDAFNDDLSLNESIEVDNAVATTSQSTEKIEVQETPTIELKGLPTECKDMTPVAKKQVTPVEMWVDKYKPKTLKQIIGQQGEKSNAKKLLMWLRNWIRNTKNKKPAVAGKWNTNDDGSGFRAALLSGPPGVGKTTTAHLVCKEAGFDFLELNASDTRSKKSLQQAIVELLKNQSLASCFNDSVKGSVSRNHVIIMDEVDGMAGNEDRGGMQELIGFIKATKIPIICICNDRNHTKIRSLSNYCFDLRFMRPRVEQIKAAMMSIAFKEGLKLESTVLQDIITATNQDIRQVLHNLSMWCAKSKGLTAEQVKADIGHGTKHIKLGPFDVLREVFTIGQNAKATINDKASLFFHDYSIAPLFVQENYVHVLPTKTNGNRLKHLELLSNCADSICTGDIVEKQIRSQASWSMLPVEAIFASVIPGDLMVGHLKQMINFPAWLGKNSNRNHMDRILQELQMHMRTRITGNKTEVSLEYLPLLKHALTKPLIEKEVEGVPDALKVMENYCLLREDFDSIIDLSLWSNQTDPRSKINTKVKSAFTRTYNKECSQNPYAVSNVSKKKKGSTKDSESELLGGEDSVRSEEEGSDDEKLENDAMIKMKKPTKASAAKSDTTTKKKSNKAASKKGRTK